MNRLRRSTMSTSPNQQVTAADTSNNMSSSNNQLFSSNNRFSTDNRSSSLAHVVVKAEQHDQPILRDRREPIGSRV